MQARTSYVGDEIHWGHLFVDIMEYRDTSIDGGYYDIDISRFHETFEVELPRGTAREFYERRLEENDGECSQSNSQQREMKELENTNETDAAPRNDRSGVALIPNGDVGKQDGVTKLWPLVLGW